MGGRASERKREREGERLLFIRTTVNFGSSGIVRVDLSEKKEKRERERGGERIRTIGWKWRKNVLERDLGGKNGNRRDGADRTVDDDRIGTQDGRGEEGSVARVVDGKNRKGTRS